MLLLLMLLIRTAFGAKCIFIDVSLSKENLIFLLHFLWNWMRMPLFTFQISHFMILTFMLLSVSLSLFEYVRHICIFVCMLFWPRTKLWLTKHANCLFWTDELPSFFSFLWFSFIQSHFNGENKQHTHLQTLRLFDFHRLTETNCLLNDVLEAVRPHVNLNFDNILAHINTIYVLKTKSGVLAGQGYLRLKVSNKHFVFASLLQI